MPAERPRSPQLSEFVAGYGGPSPIAYRGGTVKVTAVLVYADGVAIEWFVAAVPDLSWMPDEGPPTAERIEYLDRFKDRPEVVQRMERFKSLSSFWSSAVLTDDIGTRYERRGGEASSEDGIHRGREVFSPAPPARAIRLTVRVHDLTVEISLRPT